MYTIPTVFVGLTNTFFVSGDSKKVTVGVHSCYNVFNSLVFNDWYHWFLDNDISLRGRNSVTMHPWQEPEAYTVKILLLFPF